MKLHEILNPVVEAKGFDSITDIDELVSFAEDNLTDDQVEEMHDELQGLHIEDEEDHDEADGIIRAFLRKNLKA